MKDYEEEGLRTAKEALQTYYETLVNTVRETAAGDHRHLTAKDKIETDWGLLSLTAGYQIATRSNNLEMVQAVKQAIAGTFFIVSHCEASPTTAKKLFDKRDSRSRWQRPADAYDGVADPGIQVA